MDWWILALVPVAWLVQNCLHELSHLVTAWVVYGRKPLGFFPYPHKHNGKFYFARCRYEQGPETLAPQCEIHIAPLTWGAAWFAVNLALVLMGLLWALPFAVCGLVDALWFVRGYFWSKNPWNDGQRWRYGDPS